MKETPKKYNLGLTQKIFIIFMCLLCILMSISGISFYQYFKRVSKDSSIESLQLVMKNNASNVNDLFGSIATVSQLLTAEIPDLNSMLNTPSNNTYDRFKVYQKLKNTISKYFKSTVGSFRGYRGYLIIDSSTSIAPILETPTQSKFLNDRLSMNQDYVNIIRNDKLLNEDWYQKALTSKQKPYWFRFSENSSQIWFAQYLQGTYYIQGKVRKYSLGVLLIGLDISQIQSQLISTRFTQGSHIFITDEQSRIIYAKESTYQNKRLYDIIDSDSDKDFTMNHNSDVFMTVTLNNNEYLVLCEPLIQNLELYIMVPNYQFKQQSRQIAKIVLFILLAVIMAGMFLSWIFSYFIVKPIKRLSSHMVNTKNPIPITYHGHSKDEVGLLYYSYNELVDKVNCLIQNIYASTEKQKKQELKLLYAQINPHFLYNTLDSVCCIALVHNENEIASALSALASLLRYSIKDPDKQVPIMTEVEMIENYITIQHLRCGDKLQFFYSIEPSLETVLIPKMIIQPLVENCISYGTTNVSGDITITITIQSETETKTGGQNNIIIKVHDEGISDINAINQHLSGNINISKKNGGLGIRNVLQRIQIVYGSDYGLHYTDEHGTCAVVRIPQKSNVSNQES